MFDNFDLGPIIMVLVVCAVFTYMVHILSVNYRYSSTLRVQVIQEVLKNSESMPSADKTLFIRETLNRFDRVYSN